MSGVGRVVLIGEVLVDFLGEGGAALEEARAFRPSPGGAPANAAVAAARAGASAAFVGSVGGDAFGRLLRQALVGAGVDGALLRTHPTLFTTLAFVLPLARGDAGFQFLRGADAALAPGDVGDEVLRGAAGLGCGGVSLSAPESRAATLHALQRARALGVPACFDVNWRPRLWPSASAGAAAAREAAALAEVLKCNEAELELLADAEGSAEDRARRLLAASRGAPGGPAAVVVTRAERGALWVTPDAVAAHPGFEVQAVDAVGAGDCFLGTMLAWWAGAAPGSSAVGPAAMSIAEAEQMLRRCCAAAALQTTRPGAMAAMPDRGEVDAFLRARG